MNSLMIIRLFYLSFPNPYCSTSKKYYNIPEEILQYLQGSTSVFSRQNSSTLREILQSFHARIKRRTGELIPTPSESPHNSSCEGWKPVHRPGHVLSAPATNGLSDHVLPPATAFLDNAPVYTRHTCLLGHTTFPLFPHRPGFESCRHSRAASPSSFPTRFP